MKFMIIAAVVAGLAAPAMAADTVNSPPQFGAPGKVAATLKSNPVAGVIRLGRQTVRLEDTELSTLSGRLDAPIGHRGEGKAAITWICLTDAAAQTRLWLTSGYEVDGAINGLILLKLPKAQATEHCPAMPADYAKIDLPNGLKLGMSADALKGRLGQPSYDEKGLQAFFYSGQVLTDDLRPGRAAELFVAMGADGIDALGLHQLTAPP